MGNKKDKHHSSKRSSGGRSRSRSRNRRKKSPSPTRKKSQNLQPRPREGRHTERKKIPDTFDNPETQRLKNWKAAKAAKLVDSPSNLNSINSQSLDQLNHIRQVQRQWPLQKQPATQKPSSPPRYGSEQYINQTATSSKSVNTRLKFKPHVNINKTKVVSNQPPTSNSPSNSKKLFKFKKGNEVVYLSQDNTRIKNNLFSFKSKKNNDNIVPEPLPSTSKKKNWFKRSSVDSLNSVQQNFVLQKSKKKKKSYDGSNGTFLKRGVRRGVWNVAKIAIRKNEHWSKMFEDNGINIDNINVDYVNADLIDVNGLGIENKYLKRTVTWLLK